MRAKTPSVGLNYWSLNFGQSLVHPVLCAMKKEGDFINANN